MIYTIVNEGKTYLYDIIKSDLKQINIIKISTGLQKKQDQVFVMIFKV